MRYILCFLIVCLSLSFSLCGKDSLRVETLRGPAIGPYMQEIVEVVNEIYRVHPYYYAGNNEEYTSYLEAYAKDDEAVISLVFDESKIVGLAIGVPVTKTKTLFQENLLNHHYNLNTLFYLGEFGVKLSYANLGLEKKLYSEIEAHARLMGFSEICLWEVYEASYQERRPQEYSINELFWKDLGFIKRSEVTFDIFWTNIGENEDSLHQAIFSFKEL